MSAAASRFPRFAAQRFAATMLVLAIAGTLTACVDQQDLPVPPPTATPTVTATLEPLPTGGPTSAPDVLDISCADLVDPDAVYAFNPNLALLGDWTPDAGTAAADAVDAGGLACRWVFESGAGTMDISVARLPEERIVELKNEAFAGSEMVPTYGDEAYFEIENGIGRAIVFEGRFWLVVSSASFAEPGEPSEIIDSALTALAALPEAS